MIFGLNRYGWMTLAGLVLAGLAAQRAMASENEPRRPFAEWADVPLKGQFVAGALYEQSEAYYAWQGKQRENITVHTPDGQSYGIDIRQGYFTLQYGITERWAADLNVGATTVGWRSFDNGNIAKTTGLMDLTLGVRYQLWNEAWDTNSWLPTITFRAGGVIPGGYDRYIAYRPGNHGAAIEPSLLARKHFLWTGFGAWTDLLYRWEHTTGNDQYIAAVGLFQQIKRWELDVGFRHLQATAGSDVEFIPTDGNAPYSGITYLMNVREISESVDAGFSYKNRHDMRFGFHVRKTFEGRNTDSKLWLGASIDVPFGGKKEKTLE